MKINELFFENGTKKINIQKLIDHWDFGFTIIVHKNESETIYLLSLKDCINDNFGFKSFLYKDEADLLVEKLNLQKFKYNDEYLFVCNNWLNAFVKLTQNEISVLEGKTKNLKSEIANAKKLIKKTI